MNPAELYTEAKYQRLHVTSICINLKRAFCIYIVCLNLETFCLTGESGWSKKNVHLTEAKGKFHNMSEASAIMLPGFTISYFGAPDIKPYRSHLRQPSDFSKVGKPSKRMRVYFIFLCL